MIKGRLSQQIRMSHHPLARMVRWAYRSLWTFSVPAPRIVVRPLLVVFVFVRTVYLILYRVFVCEPLFKAYCTQYGRGLNTGVFIHWVTGPATIILGDHVTIGGKCDFTFTNRYCPQPTLRVGHHTAIYACSFTIGREISIGDHCLIAAGSIIVDSNGHSTDPASRLAGLPPRPEEVRPVRIGDNVWIGMEALILPGVTIGEGSVIAARSVIRKDVEPYTVVAGNPARKVADLPHPSPPPS